MFRLHRQKLDKSGEKIDFKFSHFQALQVPSGWDKLLVSVVSVETGKTVAKSSKAVVRNSNCLWTEALSESIWFSQDDTSKELEECILKFVVSMGSARSGILGEAVVNLKDYISSRAPVPVSLSLKKCSYGTILQVKIQCLNPKPRDGKHRKDSLSNLEDLNTEYDNIDNNSDGSDNMFARSVGSSSSNHLGDNSHRELGSRDSVSGSHRSSDSEVSVGRTYSSPGNNLNGDLYNGNRRHDSSGSLSSATFGLGLADDPSRLNPSSFNSRQGLPSHFQDISGYSPSHSLAPLSLKNGNSSSKDLLETAEDTIEELRAEAKMWERNARKLKVDLELLKKEFGEQSRHQTDLDLELSTAYAERDGLKLETDQLKFLLDEVVTKQEASDHSKLRTEDMVNLQKQLEDDLKFQKESNSDLSLQLKKTQESNIELVSILQELEDTIEKQRQEIDNISSQKTELLELQVSERRLQVIVQSLEKSLEEKKQEIEQARLHTGAEPSANEEEINNLQGWLFDSHRGSDVDFKHEIESLNVKIQELERDCNELTEENLELIFKLKESKKDFTVGESFHGSDSESLRARIYQLEQNLKEKETVQTELTYLENKCSDLEIQLQSFKQKACDLSEELFRTQQDEEKKRMEFTALELQLKKYQDREIEWQNQLDVSSTRTENLVSCGPVEISKMFYELCEQIQVVREISDSHVNTAREKCPDFLKENAGHPSIQELDILKNELQSSIADLSQVLAEKTSEIEKLEASLLMKEEEGKSLRNSLTEIEMTASQLHVEKSELEKNLETTKRESSITSKCLDDVKQDLMVLTNSMGLHVSNSKLFERKSIELEANRGELESHLSELEEENVQLSERNSGMEAQLRYLTDENQANRLELQSSRCMIIDLQNELGRLGAAMESQKVEMKQKLHETHKRFSEAKEESEFLKRANLKLQSTIESLMEECSSLQRLNEELRRQRVELQERSALLESKSVESQKSLSEFHRKVEHLEGKLSSMLKEAKSKEESLSIELETLLHDHEKYEQKLIEARDLLNGAHLEKSVQVENLQREVSHLTSQISSTLDERERHLTSQISSTLGERERIASDAVLEVSSLRAEKAKLESSLQELVSKVRVCETDLNTLQVESGGNVQKLNSKLAASKEREELLIAELEHIKKLLEDLRFSGENSKLLAGDLDIKFKASEYKRQILMEDISHLKSELQKISPLQDEIAALKSSLDETKFEKGKLEETIQLLSEDSGELKGENFALMEKVSSLQKVLLEGEEAKQSRVALEEKILRLECDLTAREALCAQDAELKNELGRTKRTNNQFQRKIQQLEEEKDECLKRSQALEVELKLREGDRQKEERQVILDQEERSNVTKVELAAKVQELETKLAEALETNNMYKMQLKSFLSEDQNVHAVTFKEPIPEDESRGSNGNESRELALEAELRDLRERYFQMSLRFAEVEAEREDLVMKVKSIKHGKRWFTRS